MIHIVTLLIITNDKMQDRKSIDGKYPSYCVNFYIVSSQAVTVVFYTRMNNEQIN